MTIKRSDDHGPSETGITRRTFGRMLGAAVAATPVERLAASAVAAQTGRGSTAAAGKGDALCDLGAFELAARIRRKDVSAREVMTAHLARIERLNPKVNAIVTLVPERAMADAA